MDFKTENIYLLSQAKTNPYLEIVEREKSGYHLIRSAIFPLEISDVIKLSITEGQGGISLDVSFSKQLSNHLNYCRLHEPKACAHMLSGLEGPNNLLWKATQLTLSCLEPFLDCRISVQLQLYKRIPFGAGLGGGSANAACIARTLPRHLIRTYCKFSNQKADELEQEIRHKIMNLGSDIPALMENSPVFVLGTGHKILPMFEETLGILSSWESLGLIIVKPPCSVPTIDAYSWFDLSAKSYNFDEDDQRFISECAHACQIAHNFGFKITYPLPGKTRKLPHRPQADVKYSQSSNQFISKSGLTLSISGGNSDMLFRNDFENVVFPRYEAICEARAALLSVGASRCFLSGSGSAVIGAFTHHVDAHNALSQLRHLESKGYFVVNTKFALSSLL